MQLTFVTRSTDGYTVLEVGGELDVYTAPELRMHLIEIVEEGQRKLILDMNRIEFLDSTALGVLVYGLKRLRSTGGTLALVCQPERLLKIFRITGLDRVFDIYGSVEAALGKPSQSAPVTDVTQPKPRQVPGTSRNRAGAKKMEPAATTRTPVPASRVAVEAAKPPKRTQARRPSPAPISIPACDEPDQEIAAIRVIVVRGPGGDPIELTGEPEIEVVAFVDSMAETTDLIVALEPAVAVIDVDLPDGSGLDLARALRTSRRALGIVMLSVRDSDDVLLGALDSGASAFVPRNSPTATLASAVRHSVAAPHHFSAEGLAEAVARRLAS